MEARFYHWIKKRLLRLFLSQFKLKSSFEGGGKTYVLRIASLYHTILWKKS